MPSLNLRPEEAARFASLAVGNQMLVVRVIRGGLHPFEKTPPDDHRPDCEFELHPDAFSLAWYRQGRTTIQAVYPPLPLASVVALKEAWQPHTSANPPHTTDPVMYAAYWTGFEQKAMKPWLSPVTMPLWAVRSWAEVARVMCRRNDDGVWEWNYLLLKQKKGPVTR